MLTSVAPRAWGFSVMGSSPTVRKTMNSLVVKGLDIRKFGGCNATALLCGGYANKDPLVTHSIQNIIDFAETVVLCPLSFHMVLEQIWPKLRDELEVPHRWSKVKGPISSAIATLWDHGFEPRSHTAWVDPQGWCWHLDYQLPNFVAALKDMLQVHIQRSVCCR